MKSTRATAPTSAAKARANERERLDGRLEIVIAIMLGLGAIITALSVYLIDQHDDEAQLKFNRAVVKTSEASASYVEGAQQQGADESLFFEYVNAAQDRVPVAQYLLTQIMRPELKQMVLWWSDSDEQTPFVEANPYYKHPELDHADQLSAEARDDFETANDEQNAGDRFIMVGVIVAASLFLFGIAGVTDRFSIRVGTMAMGGLTFLVALGLLLTGL